MKRLALLANFLIILLFVTASIHSQTSVPGGDVSGTWTKAGSPYIIEGDINIPSDGTLSIEPGTILHFNPEVHFIIRGQLLARGTMNDSILFTVPDTTGSWDIEGFTNWWGGLRFIEFENDPDSSLLSYCLFEFSRAFSDQYAMDNGGAVYIEGGFKIRINNCLFENNTALGGELADGGAMHLQGVSGTRIIDNIFRNNKAAYGGAISIYESTPIMQGNHTEGNQADYGGGYSITNSDLSILSNVFNSNRCTENGGAILVITSAGRSSLEIYNCSFSGNHAGNEAGCIEIGNGELRCNSSVFTNNGCDWIGGVLKVFDNSFLELVDCEFRNNSAPVFGGVMGSYESFMEIEDCIFADNDAGVLGGAIHSDWSQLAIRRSVFERDSSGETGGAFWLWHCNAEFEDCNFNDNTARYNYGAIGADSTDIVIDNSNFRSNQAVWGGAIGVHGGSLEMQYCSVDYNEGEHGGAINIGWSNLDLYSCEFGQNKGIWGGAIDAYNCNIEIELCSFGGNHATDMAGAIQYVVEPVDLEREVSLFIRNSEFISNKSDNSIGAVMVSQNNTKEFFEHLVVDRCLFKENQSGNDGIFRVTGGVAECVFSNTFFQGNTTKYNRSILGIHNGIKGMIYNCLFTDNQPRALVVHDQADLVILNSTFQGSSGTAVDIRRGGIARIANSIIWGNGRPAALNTAADLGCQLSLKYCDVQYGMDSVFVSDTASSVEWGEGNIDSDPRFFNISDDDFSLYYDSPCLETGSPNIEFDELVYDAPGTDIVGNHRPLPVGTNPDMGAYESSVPAGVIDPYLIGSQESRMWVIPNPVQTTADISWFMKETEDIRIDLFDISGRHLNKICAKTGQTGLNQIEYDFSGVKQGIYILKLSSGRISLNSRITVVN